MPSAVTPRRQRRSLANVGARCTVPLPQCRPERMLRPTHLVTLASRGSLEHLLQALRSSPPLRAAAKQSPRSHFIRQIATLPFDRPVLSSSKGSGRTGGDRHPMHWRRGDSPSRPYIRVASGAVAQEDQRPTKVGAQRSVPLDSSMPGAVNHRRERRSSIDVVGAWCTVPLRGS